MSEMIAIRVQPAIHIPGRRFHAKTRTTGPRTRRRVVSVTGTQLKRLVVAVAELALTSLLYRTPSARPVHRQPSRDKAAGIRPPCALPKNCAPRARGKPAA